MPDLSRRLPSRPPPPPNPPSPLRPPSPPSPPSPPRPAAGRARALGIATRGTTSPNRLRRMDRWILATLGQRLRGAATPLVIDLGFGSSAVTTLELAARLATVRDDVRVLGLELDPARVATAMPFADPHRTDFARGGFEFAGHRPALVRAANVLRQYDEAAAARAWATMRANLAPGGLLVEGTCDELGRRATWVLLDADGPRTLTLSARLADLPRPGALAERLPKALIHHNVPGRPIHRLLRDLDAAWDASAPLIPFGPRQRWIAMSERVRADWPVLGGPARWRLGELTVQWAAVAPEHTRN